MHLFKIEVKKTYNFGHRAVRLFLREIYDAKNHVPSWWRVAMHAVRAKWFSDMESPPL